MGSTFYFGRRVTTTDTDMGTIAPGGQRAYVPNRLTQTIIAYRMEMLGGKSAGFSAPRSRMGIGLSLDGGTPDNLLAVTSEFSPTADMTSGSNGTVYGANLTAPLLMRPDDYALVMTSRSASLEHAMRSAAGITANNEKFYYKTGLSSTFPTNPITGNPTTEGHMDLWVVAVTNTAPATPIDRVPVGDLVSTDLTPQLQSRFSDAEQTLPNGVTYDYLNQVQIAVRRKSDGVSFWNITYNATSTERDASFADIQYAGTALVAGVEYEWQTRHSDRAGAWSPWSTWLTFRVASAGSVARPSAPSGRVNTLNGTALNMSALWTHAGGLSTNAVQARLKNAEGSILKTSAEIARTVANNGTISITWSESAFGTLTAGTKYFIEIRGRDTGNIWSPWSASQAFNTDARPTTPTGLSPANGAIVTGLPLLTALTSDADDATSGLRMTFEITRSDATKVTVTGTYNATTKRHEYRVTSTDLPSFQIFSVRAFADDTFLASSWSTANSITYAQGPVVTVTEPALNATIVTSTPRISWTTSEQVQAVVRLYQQGSNRLLLTQTFNDTTTRSTVIPPTYLYNGVGYYVTVTVTDTLNLVGHSEAHTFTLQYPALEQVSGFVAYPRFIGHDAVASAIELNWDRTAYAASQFEGYDIFRVPVTGTDDPEEGTVFLRRIMSPMQNSFVDYHPRSGVGYEYVIRQNIRMGSDLLVSPDSVGQAQINLEGIVLAAALVPDTYRIDLRFLGSGSGPDHELKMDQRQKVPIGARHGRTIRSRFRSWEDGGRFNVISDQFATAEQRITRIREAIANGKTFSYRDDKKRKRWVTITAYKEFDFRERYEVDIQVREEHFVEGENL